MLKISMFIYAFISMVSANAKFSTTAENLEKVGQQMNRPHFLTLETENGNLIDPLADDIPYFYQDFFDPIQRKNF